MIFLDLSEMLVCSQNYVDFSVSGLSLGDENLRIVPGDMYVVYVLL